MARYLITGGLGFIGFNAALRCAKQGHTAVLFDDLSRRTSLRNLEMLRRLRSDERFKDFRDSVRLHLIRFTDTPAKRREYQEEVFGTIFIRNVDVKETMDALRVVGDLRSIAPITGLNAITVRDPV